ncbi:hypothetical protein AKJ09_03858 [Labilithrix luteola]|uniref:Co-chaperone DjlA N-terminal domain-containing protein n=1 Tax=Labilithrix luteola TaxID=1391654 RepID=A0A0K1PVP4_9BACT|nr:DUF533 domain-containing protein [Labilithrix luteola]AKU97194.1 hypothetical protein AKJ09_03858 [Labilithrix luteola]
MKRLTISADACTETLALLITMAWADGDLEDRERQGVRAASEIFNLTKELRARLDQLLERPLTVGELLFDAHSARDKSFAFVAAAWMSGLDENVHEKEKALLDEVATLFGFTENRKAELVQIARDLEPLRKPDETWANELQGHSFAPRR